MNWLTLSFKDLQRRPLRTGITIAGVTVSIAALFSLLSFQSGYATGIRNEVDGLGAHILVTPKGCPYDAASIALHGANWPCYLKTEYLAEVRSARGVAAAAPALMSAFYDPTGRQMVYVGIDSAMLALKRHWRIQGRFPEREEEVLLGRAAADRLGCKPGERVRLPGLRNAEGIVAGILESTGGADDTFTFLRLADAQRLMRHPGELTHILVRLDDANDLDAVVRELRGCDAGLYMNVVPLAHLFRTIQNLMGSTRLLLGCLGLVALILAGAGVSNTLLMMVAERTREIGVLRALGASRTQVFGLFWLQTMHTCLLGGLSGIVAAYAGSRLVEGWLRARLPFAPTEPFIHWDPKLGVLCLACAAGLGGLAGFIPAWRASSMPPDLAMRPTPDAP